MLTSTYAFPEDGEVASSVAREGLFPSSPERLALDRDVNPIIRPVIRDHRKDRLPRYTSYPTAPNFTTSVTADDFRGWLAGLTPEANASLYLHVPFCRSMCWYCGCHTTVAQRDAPIADYLVVILKEIDVVAETIGGPLSVGRIHFGGGTPTIMQPPEFLALTKRLRDLFRVRPEAEIALEIDPRRLSSAMISALAEAGVTRASLGVQSFDPIVQRAINRIQSVDQTASAASGLRAAGIRAINFDLIYGLPHQTVASCLETVRQSLALRPDRLAVFGYAHVPGFKKHQRKIDERALPGANERFEQAEAIGAALLAGGYRRIGLDHYALPGDEMVVAQESGRLRRNFQGYTTDRSDALIGFGASAISRLPQGYIQNEVVIARHAEHVLHGRLPVAKGYRLTEDDRLRADVIERLMCDFEVDLDEVCARHGASASSLIKASEGLIRLAREGLVQIDAGRIRIIDRARPFVRVVASAFDAHLPGDRVFSGAI